MKFINILAKVVDGAKESLGIYKSIDDGDKIVVVLQWVKSPKGNEIPMKWVACEKHLFLNVSGNDFDNTLSPPIDLSQMPPEPIDFMADIIDIDPESYRPWRQ
jgi:hypothetical protein